VSRAIKDDTLSFLIQPPRSPGLRGYLGYYPDPDRGSWGILGGFLTTLGKHGSLRLPYFSGAKVAVSAAA
jgi:hypothetical protein